MEVSEDALYSLIEERCASYYASNKGSIQSKYHKPHDNQVLLLVFDTVDDLLRNKHTISVTTIDEVLEFMRENKLETWRERGNISELKSRHITPIAAEIKSLDFTRYVYIEN